MKPRALPGGFGGGGALWGRLTRTGKPRRTRLFPSIALGVNPAALYARASPQRTTPASLSATYSSRVLLPQANAP
jgi:hypothetical protein